MAFIEEPMDPDPTPQIEEIVQIITLPIRRDSGLDDRWTKESLKLHSAFRTISKQPGWVRTLWDRDLQQLDKCYILVTWKDQTAAHNFSSSSRFTKVFSSITTSSTSSIQVTTFLLRSASQHPLHAGRPTKTYTFSFPPPEPPPYVPSASTSPHSQPSTSSHPAPIQTTSLSFPTPNPPPSIDKQLAETLSSLFDPNSFEQRHSHRSHSSPSHRSYYAPHIHASTPQHSHNHLTYGGYIPPDLPDHPIDSIEAEEKEDESPLISFAQGPSIFAPSSNDTATSRSLPFDHGGAEGGIHAYMIVVTWRSLDDMYASRSDVDMVFSAVLSQFGGMQLGPDSVPAFTASNRGGGEVGGGGGGYGGAGSDFRGEGVMEISEQMRCEGMVFMGLKEVEGRRRKIVGAAADRGLGLERKPKVRAGCLVM